MKRNEDRTYCIVKKKDLETLIRLVNREAGTNCNNSDLKFLSPVDSPSPDQIARLVDAAKGLVSGIKSLIESSGNIYSHDGHIQLGSRRVVYRLLEAIGKVADSFHEALVAFEKQKEGDE